MQSFFNNNEDDERELTELTNTIFETLINDYERWSRYLSSTPDAMDSLRDTVYKLVKIASEQNKLLLQFPAVLAYFVYNFLKNIDLDRINDINEKLDNIQRLIQRKNLQGLSFSTIKQLLQQELQEKKFRRNRPNKGEKQQEQQKQSGKKQGEKKQSGKGERQQQEGEKEGEKQQEGKEGQESESEESQGQQGQELGEESQEGNEQENEKQGQQEGEEGSQEEVQQGGEGEQQGGEQGGEQQSGEEGNQEEGEEGGEEGELGGQQNGEEGEEQGNENEGEQGQELGEEGQQSGEEGNEGEQGNVQEGQESEGESENEGQNSEEQEGQNGEQGGEQGNENEENQSGEESGEGQNGEQGEESQEGNEQENEGQSGNEAGQSGEEGGEQEGEEEGEEQESGEGQESESEGSQSGEGETQEGEGGEQQSGEEGNQGQNSEQGQESGGEGQQSENEDIIEDLENNIDEESRILDELQESLQMSLSALSIGKGSGGGVLKDINPRVLELLESANRLLALANQVDLQYANRGVKDQGGVMKGITTGNNVKHMFKSQLVLPDEIFLERYTNRALLQRAVENEGVGDLYFMIDQSGSMGTFMPNGYTAFENVSAVALASAMEAEKNSKKVFVQYFSSSTTEPIDVNNVFELAQTQPGGGTDMMVALRQFMEYYNNYPGLKDVKQIFILSDFETNYDTTLYHFKNFARNNGLVVTCIHVYNGEVPEEMQYIIDEICDEYYKFNDYDAGELFSAVYSKI